MEDSSAFAPEILTHLDLWRARPDGRLIATRSSWVLPVRRDDTRAMLKVARMPDERLGFGLMRWWDGDGAAPVLEFGEAALLLERATGSRDLAAMARDGQDDEACRILCATAMRLHEARPSPPPELHPLETWFRPLFELSRHHAALKPAVAVARELLANPRSAVPLHGDLHHENVLDFGERGWLAIDPHGLLGERWFDFANIFTNPDLGDPHPPVATLPGRLEARLKVVTETADIEPRRMLQWIVAWTGLSAAWFIDDGDDGGATIDLAVNDIARTRLDA